MPVTGADVVASRIIKFGGGFLQSVNKIMRNVEAMVDEKVTENMSLSDHSLEDLRKLGHPYAARAPQNLHDPAYQVHTQGSLLLESKSHGTIDASIENGNLKATAYVKLDPSIAPHAVFVVYGTSKMVPRPVLGGSRDEIRDDVIAFMQSNLKDARINIS